MRRLFLACLLMAALPLYGAIAFDAGAGTFSASGSTINLSLTIASGSNLYLLAFVGCDGGATVTSVNWNTSEAMTLLSGPLIHNSGSNRNYVYYLKAPTTGTHNVTVAMSTSSTSVAVGAASFSGVDQTTPNRTPCENTDSFSGDDLSCAATSSSGDLVIDWSAWRTNACTLTGSGASQTANFTEIAGGPRGISTRKAGAASSTTMTETIGTGCGGSRTGALSAIALIPAAAAGRRRMIVNSGGM